MGKNKKQEKKHQPERQIARGNRKAEGKRGVRRDTQEKRNERYILACCSVLGLSKILLDT